MIFPDVNVLVYAFRKDSPDHSVYRAWLTELLEGDSPFALCPQVVSGFLRVVTHPRIFKQPSSIDAALNFAGVFRGAPGATQVSPGPLHGEIFEALCRESGATGHLVPDAFLAAIAVEWGCELASADGDFARFSRLRYRHPLG